MVMDLEKYRYRQPVVAGRPVRVPSTLPASDHHQPVVADRLHAGHNIEFMTVAQYVALHYPDAALTRAEMAELEARVAAVADGIHGV